MSIELFGSSASSFPCSTNYVESGLSGYLCFTDSTARPLFLILLLHYRVAPHLPCESAFSSYFLSLFSQPVVLSCPAGPSGARDPLLRAPSSYLLPSSSSDSLCAACRWSPCILHNGLGPVMQMRMHKNNPLLPTSTLLLGHITGCKYLSITMISPWTHSITVELRQITSLPSHASSQNPF